MKWLFFLLLIGLCIKITGQEFAYFNKAIHFENTNTTVTGILPLNEQYLVLLKTIDVNADLTTYVTLLSNSGEIKEQYELHRIKTPYATNNGNVLIRSQPDNFVNAFK